MQDFNYKTIFVLDHTQYFSISSEEYITLDYIRGKTNLDNLASSPPGTPGAYKFSKSLWTNSVEAAIEYCRIVWDIFPRNKLVRFIVSDKAAHIVNTWDWSTQNTAHVLNAMALVGIPQRNAPPTSDYSVIHGLRAAIEALAETPEPHEGTTGATGGVGEKSLNKGRVICITSTRDNASMKSLEEIFHTVLMQQNALAATQKHMLPLQHCHLVLINLVPEKIESLVTDRVKMELSPILTSEIHSTTAPRISNKLLHLIMGHYNLASTTVTGIPMKEEQNANSSANYDVEILHPREAHTVICGNEVLLPTSIKEGAEYETVTLKWCTPRGCGSSDGLPCMAQYRVTPVDVTSRPSACLINFLLNGRSVLLEMPRKTGGKTTSHLLSARGAEIFIHSLQITRSVLEDLPSINDAAGGRVADYRVADHAAFNKAHRLVPLKSKSKPDEDLIKERERIARRSRYFPLTQSTSLVYNLHVPWLQQFLRKIVKEDMDKSDEALCQKYIFELYTAVTKGEPLPYQSLVRIKSQKRAELNRLLCSELEAIIRCSSITPHHKTILESVQNIRSMCSDSTVKAESDASRDSISKGMTSSNTDSPMSPPHLDSSSNSSMSLLKSSKRNLSNNGTRSLMDIVLAAERSQSSKRIEFSGRLCTPAGQVAKLYPNLGAAKEKEGTPTAAAVGGGITTGSKNEADSSGLKI